MIAGVYIMRCVSAVQQSLLLAVPHCTSQTTSAWLSVASFSLFNKAFRRFGVRVVASNRGIASYGMKSISR
jgi:hypothetical protein